MKRRVYGGDYQDRLSREDASGNLRGGDKGERGINAEGQNYSQWLADETSPAWNPVPEDGRILNPLYGDNYYEGTGTQDLRYIPKYLTEEGGVNTFMGIPKRKSPRSEIDYDSLYR